jgi:hypothetical protein
VSAGQLASIVAAIPLLTALIEWLGGSDISERHHSHHDTYLVPRQFSVSLALMMIFVGIFGLIVGWLCTIGVFSIDIVSLYTFFTVFLSVTFIMWLGIRRYRIVTFKDRLSVTPFLGPTRTIRYIDIDHLQWRHAFLSPSYPSLYIDVGGQSTFLWGTIDLEQVLLRIDRYDILERADVWRG